MENNSSFGSALLKNYARYDVEFDHGEGICLYDKSGKRYLDFLSGIAVTGFGHNHPEIKQAAVDQINRLWHVSNLFDSSLQRSLADKMAEKSQMDYVFFCNSGTEANEGAIKFARKWGKGRYQIISTLNSFHGRTLGALAATGQYKLWEGFTPLPDGFTFVPYGDAEALERVYSPLQVAVIVEPIQGEGGIILPPEGYLKAVRQFCTKHNMLMIVDEVQSGVGRTGKFYSYQYEEVKPDIVTSAKGIANGIPLGAVLCSREVGDLMAPGSHGSTFGGNPVAVAAANKVMDLLDDNMLSHIRKMGEVLRDSIKALNSVKISEVRGRGLMIGVEVSEGVSAKDIAKALLENGVAAGTSGEKALRLLPPFVMNEENIKEFIEIFEKVLGEV